MTAPTDVFYTDQWHFNYLSGEFDGTREKLELIWDEYSGDGVHLGISDTSVDRYHPEWSARFQIVTSITIETTDGAVYVVTDNDRTENHGNSVAGLIAAAMDGIGTVGLAHEVTISSIDVFFDYDGDGSHQFGDFAVDKIKNYVTGSLTTAAIISPVLTDGAEDFGSYYVPTGSEAAPIDAGGITPEMSELMEGFRNLDVVTGSWHTSSLYSRFLNNSSEMADQVAQIGQAVKYGRGGDAAAQIEGLGTIVILAAGNGYDDVFYKPTGSVDSYRVSLLEEANGVRSYQYFDRALERWEFVTETELGGTKAHAAELNTGTDHRSNSRFTVTVGAYGGEISAEDNPHGDAIESQVTPFSSRGASLLVSAPSRINQPITSNLSDADIYKTLTGGTGGVDFAHNLNFGDGVVTTDVVGVDGYNWINGGDNNYTDNFGGTSAATPQVSALVALMLEANPDLGWRDVQNILAYSARHVGTQVGVSEAVRLIKRPSEQNDWFINEATNWNGGGLHFSNDYGFGAIDVYTAVRMAEVWTLFGDAQVSLNEGVQSRINSSNSLDEDPDNSDFSIMEITVSSPAQNIIIEYVKIKFSLTHQDFSALEILLMSEKGTEVVLHRVGQATTNNFAYEGVTDDPNTLTFGVNAFRGELAGINDIWTLKFNDLVGNITISNLDFYIYGSTTVDNTVYHYTDEIFDGQFAARQTDAISDSSGNNTLNAAAISYNLDINLDNTNGNWKAEAETSASVWSSFAAVESNTEIDNAIGGDGNDTIRGNARSNSLVGMRGDDTLQGADGNDTLIGGVGADSLDGGSGFDTVSYKSARSGVTLDLQNNASNLSDALGDIYVNIERYIGSEFSDTMKGSADADSLAGEDGDDVLTGGSDGSDWIFGGAGDDKIFGGGLDDTLFGSLGNDTIYGGGGADTINGGDGIDTADYTFSDMGVSVDLSSPTVAASGGHASGDLLEYIENLTGSDHADTLIGNANDNTLIGGALADSLDGGDGDDTADYSASGVGVTVYLDGSLGVGGDATGDILTNIEHLIGSNHADTLNGDAGVNTLQGGDGIDKLYGNSGDDTLIGGSGADILGGSTGNDTADYSASTQGVTIDLSTLIDNDYSTGYGGDAQGDQLWNIENLIGSAFSDTLKSDAGGKLFGGAGDDTLNGDGAVLLDGGVGIDTVTFKDVDSSITIDLSGSSSNSGSVAGVAYTGIEAFEGTQYGDTLIGTNADTGTGYLGNDILIGGGGADSIYGGTGNDTLIGGVGVDELYGGADNNTASYRTSTTGVMASLNVPSNNSNDASGDSYDNIQNLEGTAYNDYLVGNTDVNILWGGAGDDTLDGLGDKITVDANGETMFGGTAGDVFFGGSGIDTVTYKNARSNDTSDHNGVFVRLGPWRAQDIITTGETIDAYATGDFLHGIENVEGSKHDDIIVGSGGDNTLWGKDGNDQLFGDIYGRNGSDTLYGGNGGDFLSGNAGNDSIYGGVGDDTLNGGAGTIASASGDDLLNGGEGGDTLNGGLGQDTASYFDSNAAVDVNLKEDTASGGHATGDQLNSIEHLIGSSFEDELTGDTSDNYLYGNDGDDTFYGGAGTDRLYGGVGNDALTGGAGADRFIFESLSGVDVITDFEDGTDLINVNALGLTWADLGTNWSISANGGNATIEFSTGHYVILNGIDSANITASDFIF